jgi:8-oxo-dGTP diphosphatase
MLLHFKIGVFAIIANELGHVLLARRSDMDAWNLPGGGREAHEILQTALKREVMEEVGLQVTWAKLVNMSFLFPEMSIVLTYECKCTHQNASMSAEAIDVDWFAPDHLPLKTLPRHKERINAWRKKRFAVLLQRKGA